MNIGWIALVSTALLGAPEPEATVLLDKLATCHSLADRACLVAAARLSLLGRAAVAPLERRFRDLPSEAQILALGVLGGVPDRAAGDLLLALAADRRLDAAVRALALDDLSPRHHPRGIDLFLATARDRASLVRVASARALANHLYARDHRVLAALLVLARDPDAPVRLEAIFGLGFSGDERAGKPLAAALADPDPSLRRAAAEGLGLVPHPPAVRPLAALLDDPDPLLAKAALRAIKFQTGQDLGEDPAAWRRSIERPAKP